MTRIPSILWCSAVTALAIHLGAITARSADDKVPGQVHDYPGPGAHSSTRPHNLSFEYPSDGIARAEFRSEDFYAIILKSADKCALSETDRLQIQGLFPKNKVFMDRFGCDDDIEENITYTNVDPDYSFIAVHGGAGIEEARLLLDEMDLARKFPGANIRKMQAVLVYP